MINFSTGPVGILPSVAEALIQQPISHRSAEFKHLHFQTVLKLCEKLHTREAFIFTGSGTLANDIMIGQIASRQELGLILCNGEFGNRLLIQATRAELNFETMCIPWGTQFELEQIESILKTNKVKWVLLCHCESSTGVLNPLPYITDLCISYDCSVYVDCISTIGTMAIDLSKTAMATASSGKGVGSVAGLAIILSNIKILQNDKLPMALDLYHAQQKGGIPFTISSNLVAGLSEAIDHNICNTKWQILDEYAQNIYDRLYPKNIIPFATRGSRIFTIIPNNLASDVANRYLEYDIKVSYESSYLTQRNWLQMALLGSYSKEEIELFLSCTANTCD